MNNINTIYKIDIAGGVLQPVWDCLRNQIDYALDEKQYNLVRDILHTLEQINKIFEESCN